MPIANRLPYRIEDDGQPRGGRVSGSLWASTLFAFLDPPGMDGTTAASGATPGGQADTATPICHPTGGAEPMPALGSPRAAPRLEASAQEAEQSPQPAPRQSSSAGEHRHMPFANTEYHLVSRGDKSQRHVQSLTSHLLLAAPAAYGTPKSRPRSRYLRRSLKEKKGGGHGDTVLSSCHLLTLHLHPVTTKTDVPSVGGAAGAQQAQVG